MARQQTAVYLFRVAVSDPSSLSCTRQRRSKDPPSVCPLHKALDIESGDVQDYTPGDEIYREEVSRRPQNREPHALSLPSLLRELDTEEPEGTHDIGVCFPSHKETVHKQSGHHYW